MLLLQGVGTTMIAASKAGKTSAAVSRFVKRTYASSGFTHLLLLGSIEDIPSPVLVRALKGACSVAGRSHLLHP